MRIFVLSVILCGLPIKVIFANPADPTQGYCQTVDPSVCGWGGGQTNTAPYKYYTTIAYSSKTGAWALESWHGQARYRGGINLAFSRCRQVNNNQKCNKDFSSHAYNDGVPYAVTVMGENPKKRVGQRGRFKMFGGFFPGNPGQSRINQSLREDIQKCQNEGYINCKPAAY